MFSYCSEYTWDDFTYDQAYQTLDLRQNVKKLTVKFAEKFQLNDLLVYDVESDYYDALSNGEVQRLADQAEIDILLYAIKKIYNIDVNDLNTNDLKKNIFFKSLDKKLYDVYSNILENFSNKLNTLNTIKYIDNTDFDVYQYLDDDYLDEEYSDNEDESCNEYNSDDEDSIIYSDEDL